LDILLIKLGALGDVVNTFPLANLLKKRLSARIHWLVAPLSFQLVAGHESVDRATLFETRSGIHALLRQIKALRAGSYDLVLDLQRILKSSLLCSAARGRRKLGFDRQRCKELTWLFPFERIKPSDPQAHMIHQYLGFARHLGIQDNTIEWGIQGCGRLPDGLPSEFVVLNIGATKPANRWTVEGFSILARLIHEQHRLPCVLTGGPADAPMAHSIQRQSCDAVCNTVGRTTLKELACILEQARVVVTCDTGPMHLAVALGTRVVALFGPSDHRRTGPFRGRVVRAGVDCAPCSKKECSDPMCMSLIRAEDVFLNLGL
jgi:ADP-heptose:LPS heptosyltransferase